jgi:hypothetical protein
MDSLLGLRRSGFGAEQLSFALRRDIRLYNRLTLQPVLCESASLYIRRLEGATWFGQDAPPEKFFYRLLGPTNLFGLSHKK